MFLKSIQKFSDMASDFYYGFIFRELTDFQIKKVFKNSVFWRSVTSAKKDKR